MKKCGIVLISLAVCLYFAGCGNPAKGQEAKAQEVLRESQNVLQVSPDVLQISQNVQTALEGEMDDAGQEMMADTDGESAKSQADTDGEEVEQEGEAVEFLGLDKSQLKEYYIYHRGEKEEVPSSKAKGLIQLISDFIEEEKHDCDRILSIVDLKSAEDLKDMSRDVGKYYIWLQFDQPPKGVLVYGRKQKMRFENGDKFIVEIDRVRGDFFLNCDQGVYEGNMVFYPWGLMGKHDEIEDFLQRYEKWRDEEQEIMADTEGEGAESQADTDGEEVEQEGEIVEFHALGTPRVQDEIEKFLQRYEAWKDGK